MNFDYPILSNHPVTNCLNYVKSTLIVAVEKSCEIWKDPELLQKACLVGLSILKLYNLYTGTKRFSELIVSLNTAQTLDFFGFMRLPRYFLHAYSASRIDQIELQNAVTEHLKKNEVIKDLDCSLNVKEQIASYIEWMEEEEEDFHTAKAFKKELAERITAAVNNILSEKFPEKQPLIIDLKEVKVHLKRTPFLTRFSDSMFVCSDILCVPVFLQEWSLINLSFYANKVGRFPLLKWLPHQCADHWVRRFMCLGFLAHLFIAIKEIRNSDLKGDNFKAAVWLAVVSSAEFVFNMAILRYWNESYVDHLMLLAKITGLARPFLAPKITILE